MYRTLFASLLGLCLLGSALESDAEQIISPVKVTGGMIAGHDSGEVRTWFGVPFAAPPIGNLRWRPPQPVIPWAGVKETQSFSPACAQTATWIPNPKSEDCLYLNIWSPKAAQKLPVIVWIHGGGFYGGTGAQTLYNGSKLSRRSVIVVTLNYRLGIFGFFAHPELAQESPEHTSGNQGIKDQIAALHWVKANIAAFGGDPSRVTIMGESAGAESVALLVASPLAKGLFQRAIAESGNDAMPIDASETIQFDRMSAEAQGIAFAQKLGAAHVSDLRKLSVEALQKEAWSPRTFVDGYVLREDLTTTYRHHRQNDVPLLVGWNAEEGKDLAPELLGTDDFNASNHRELTAKLLGHSPSATVLATYPGATDAQAKASLNQLTNDWWGWRMAYWAELQSKYGRSHAFVYFFAHRPAEPIAPCGYGCGAGHGAEIQYIFDQLDDDPRVWTSEDRQMASRLANTWASFARTGDPNGLDLPSWAPFDATNKSIYKIGDGSDLRAFSGLPDFSLFAPTKK